MGCKIGLLLENYYIWKKLGFNLRILFKLGKVDFERFMVSNIVVFLKYVRKLFGFFFEINREKMSNIFVI